MRYPLMQAVRRLIDGNYAIQFAKFLGAGMIITTVSSSAKG